VGLKLNGKHQLLVYVDDVNLLGNNIDTIKGKTQTLSSASNGFCLEGNLEKTNKYSLPSLPQNAGQNHDINIGKRSYENLAQPTYLWMTIADQNLIREEIKRRLNSGNVCYHSVQNLWSSRLLSKNI
jgi:hypothetical protein